MEKLSCMDKRNRRRIRVVGKKASAGYGASARQQAFKWKTLIWSKTSKKAKIDASENLPKMRSALVLTCSISTPRSAGIRA